MMLSLWSIANSLVTLMVVTATEPTTPPRLTFEGAGEVVLNREAQGLPDVTLQRVGHRGVRIYAETSGDVRLTLYRQLDTGDPTPEPAVVVLKVLPAAGQGAATTLERTVAAGEPAGVTAQGATVWLCDTVPLAMHAGDTVIVKDRSRSRMVLLGTEADLGAREAVVAVPQGDETSAQTLEVLRQLPADADASALDAQGYRDAVLGEVWKVVLQREVQVKGGVLPSKKAPQEELLHTTTRTPVTVLAKGPGRMVVYARRVFWPGAKPAAEDRLTVFENDALLHSLALNEPASETWRVLTWHERAGVAAQAGITGGALSTSAAKEYRFELSERTSRFVFAPSEDAEGGLLLQYRFEAESPKETPLSLTLDLGDGVITGADIKGTTVTEVAVRERVVEKETVVERERLVEVKSHQELLGLGAALGMAFSLWGGAPEGRVLASLWLTLPVWDYRLAVLLESGFTYQYAGTARPDPYGGGGVGALHVFGVPVTLLVNARWYLNDDWAVLAALGGGVCYVDALYSAGSSMHFSAWTPSVEARAGVEWSLGPGWLGARLGYVYNAPVGLGDLTGARINGLASGGPTVALHYRLGF
jgi:hypothetical protein